VAFVGLVCSACPHPVGFPDLKSLTDDTATARVMNAAQRRERMQGLIKARLPGLQGVVASADLDVAAQPAAKLSIAVRSFFEQPMQMLVTDGATVTIFDATKGTPTFLRGKADARTIEKIITIPLMPNEVVEVLLARPPDGARGRLLGVDEKEGTYELAFESPGHAPFQVMARAKDDAILRWRLFYDDGRPRITVEYGDFRALGDAVVPFAWSIQRLDTEAKEQVHFSAVDVTFNGPALPDDAFRLEPPEGIPIIPL
jgi:hypothetical protein